MSARFSSIPRRLFALVSPRLLAFALVLPAAACAPKIGDKCVLSTDCSTQGNRQCDISMPGGYCTVYNCGPNSCPDYAACYLFHAAVQGCTYNDRQTSRTSKSFCMEGCDTPGRQGSCRDGYTCADARLPPWNALLLDDNQDQPVCMPDDDSAFTNAYGEPDGAAPAGYAPDAAVCQAYPDEDAAFPASAYVDAAAGDAGDDGGALDGAIDATLLSATDAGDAATH